MLQIHSKLMLSRFSIHTLRAHSLFEQKLKNNSDENINKSIKYKINIQLTARKKKKFPIHIEALKC